MKKELQSKDFRIGNALSTKSGNIIILNMIDTDVVGTQHINGTQLGLKELDSLYPINIHEGILESFGFELSDDEGDVKHYEIGKYGIRMHEDSDFYFYHKMVNEDEYWILCELNFFHEVQNLYFALTGEELKWKHDNH